MLKFKVGDRVKFRLGLETYIGTIEEAGFNRAYAYGLRLDGIYYHVNDTLTAAHERELELINCSIEDGEITRA